MSELTNALHLLLDFPAVRYLMCNTHGRLNGGEKAEKHIQMTDVMCKVFVPKKQRQLRMFIHDWTQQLTSNLDTEIGFPIDDPHPDYDRLTPLFIDRFIELTLAAIAASKEMEQWEDFNGKYDYVWWLNRKGV